MAGSTKALFLHSKNSTPSQIEGFSVVARSRYVCWFSPGTQPNDRHVKADFQL